MKINTDHLIDTINALSDDLVMRYKWTPWCRHYTLLPKTDIHGKRVWGRLWRRERWVLDHRLITNTRKETQYVSNVLDMIRANDV